MPIAEIDSPPQVGEFYVNNGTGKLVEIMDVDASGNVMILDVNAPLDGDCQPLTQAQISSCFWTRVRRQPPPP